MAGKQYLLFQQKGKWKFSLRKKENQNVIDKQEKEKKLKQQPFLKCFFPFHFH